MKRYIDVELLKENFAKRLNQYDGITIKIDDAAVTLGLAIADTPTADVVEVKHGKWEEVHIQHEGCAEVYYNHKECKISPNELYKSPFEHCPRCGAKMDGVKEE